MALTVKFATPAIVLPGDGSVRVRFDDGTEQEFETATAMRDTLAATLPSLDSMRSMAIMQRMTLDPALDSPLLWDGKTVTLDYEQSNPALVFRVI